MQAALRPATLWVSLPLLTRLEKFAEPLLRAAAEAAAAAAATAAAQSAEEQEVESPLQQSWLQSGAAGSSFHAPGLGVTSPCLGALPLPVEPANVSQDTMQLPAQVNFACLRVEARSTDTCSEDVRDFALFNASACTCEKHIYSVCPSGHAHACQAFCCKKNAPRPLAIDSVQMQPANDMNSVRQYDVLTYPNKIRRGPVTERIRSCG